MHTKENTGWVKPSRGTPALHLYESTSGSWCLPCMGWVWCCYCIFLIFVCFDQKKSLCFTLFQSIGWLESKNKTNCERKSAMSSINPSIIHFSSFKCKAGVPLYGPIQTSPFFWRPVCIQGRRSKCYGWVKNGITWFKIVYHKCIVKLLVKHDPCTSSQGK